MGPETWCCKKKFPRWLQCVTRLRSTNRKGISFDGRTSGVREVLVFLRRNSVVSHQCPFQQWHGAVVLGSSRCSEGSSCAFGIWTLCSQRHAGYILDVSTACLFYLFSMTKNDGIEPNVPAGHFPFCGSWGSRFTSIYYFLLGGGETPSSEML